MQKLPYGRQKVVDDLQRWLDDIETAWPMTASYERVDPFIVPYMQGGAYFELIIYHIESKLWFEQSHHDQIAWTLASEGLIGPGDVVFDLGSNAGALSLVMARLAGDGGHIHAFDPYPWNTAATVANARLNHLGNVTGHNVGLGNRNHDIMVLPTSAKTYEAAEGQGAQRLIIRDIADYMGLRPTYLKIDIEGAEHDLFEDQPAGTFDSVRGFALEFHPFFLRPRGLDPRTSLRNIQRAGFSLHHNTPSAPPYDVEAFRDDDHLIWGRRAD